MKKRLISGVVFVLIIALGFVLKFYVSNYFFDAIILAVAGVGTFEASRIFSKMGKVNDKIMSMLYPAFAMLTALLCIHFDDKIGIIYTIAILVGLMILFFLLTFCVALLNKNTTTFEMKNQNVGISKSKYCITKAFNTVLTFIYPSFLIMFLTYINHFEELKGSFAGIGDFGGRLSLFVLIFTLLVPIITDTFAYLTGSIFGGKKLAPSVSPNKTISGAIGGTIWCVAFAIVTFCIFNAFSSYEVVFSNAGISIWKIAIIAFVGSIIGQCGDLFESYLKRQAGVKDSGKIMPGHGGILDRFDSHIAVAPIMFIAFAIIFALI